MWPPTLGTEARPVVGVDWCDAWSFCDWAGKRLCGALDGSQLPFTSAGGATSEWSIACSRDGQRVFPYGDVVEVGTMATCEGGFAGVRDMSGNAHEWIDACAGNGECALLGGGIGGHSAADMQCSSAAGIQRTLPGDDGGLSWIRETGFRCCGTPPS
jgi:formylglycine-generating enzyme required for sulfatase activity